MGYLIYPTIYSSLRSLSFLYSTFPWSISISLSSVPSLVRSLCSDFYLPLLSPLFSIVSFRFSLVCSCLSVHSFLPSLPWFVPCVSTSSCPMSCSIPLLRFYSVYSHSSVHFPLPSLPWFVLCVSIFHLPFLITCSVPSFSFYSYSCAHSFLPCLLFFFSFYLFFLLSPFSL